MDTALVLAVSAVVILVVALVVLTVFSTGIGNVSTVINSLFGSIYTGISPDTKNFKEEFKFTIITNNVKRLGFKSLSFESILEEHIFDKANVIRNDEELKANLADFRNKHNVIFIIETTDDIENLCGNIVKGGCLTKKFASYYILDQRGAPELNLFFLYDKSNNELNIVRSITCDLTEKDLIQAIKDSDFEINVKIDFEKAIRDLVNQLQSIIENKLAEKPSCGPEDPHQEDFFRFMSFNFEIGKKELVIKKDVSCEDINLGIVLNNEEEEVEGSFLISTKIANFVYKSNKEIEVEFEKEWDLGTGKELKIHSSVNPLEKEFGISCEIHFKF